jgi:hypothetical protein
MPDRREPLLAVFADPKQLADAIRAMQRGGNDRLEALSPIPLPELDELLPERPSQVRWFALVGCIAGAFFGMGLQVMTVLEWPLLVGGKPVVSLPAFVVIAFEMTILFGGLATMLGLMLNAKLPPIAKECYHAGCSRSDFALVVWHEPSEYASVEAALREAGAREVRPAGSFPLDGESIGQ